MKTLIAYTLLLFIYNTLPAQKADTLQFKNPVDIPDTQRIPPNRNQPDTIKKLPGGALIDTTTVTPKTVFPKNIDDRDSLRNRN